MDRPNTELARSIDEALAVAVELGPRAAARFLNENRVGFALICRVLADPERRRKTCRIGQIAGLSVAKLP